MIFFIFITNIIYLWFRLIFLLYNITPTLAPSDNPARHSFMTFDVDSVVSAARHPQLLTRGAYILNATLIWTLKESCMFACIFFKRFKFEIKIIIKTLYFFYFYMKRNWLILLYFLLCMLCTFYPKWFLI